MTPLEGEKILKYLTLVVAYPKPKLQMGQIDVNGAILPRVIDFENTSQLTPVT
jgi:hypothetical protein